MKIKLEFEDNDIMYDVLDHIFVALLKSNLKSEQEALRSPQGYYHEDDVAIAQKNIACYKHLIKHYSAPSEVDDEL